MTNLRWQRSTLRCLFLDSVGMVCWRIAEAVILMWNNRKPKDILIRMITTLLTRWPGAFLVTRSERHLSSSWQPPFLSTHGKLKELHIWMLSVFSGVAVAWQSHLRKFNRLNGQWRLNYLANCNKLGLVNKLLRWLRVITIQKIVRGESATIVILPPNCWPFRSSKIRL